MFLVDLVFALVIAFLLTIVFVVAFRRSGPWASLVAFFFIIFLAAWAGGIWVTPVGNTVFGVYWFPFILVGLIFALILAAATAVSKRPSVPEVKGESPIKEERLKERKALDVFFWSLIAVLVAVIVLGYVYAP